MLSKRSSVLILVIAIQFSQILAAPQALNDGTESVSESVIPQPENNPDSAVAIPTESFSHTLTREEELRLLQKIPEFGQAVRSLETLPDEIYDKIKTFLMNIVPEMPQANLITLHFQNALIMIQLFERLMKATHNNGAQFQPQSRELFQQVHEAVPRLKFEMKKFNEIIQDAKTILQPNPENMATKEEDNITNGNYGATFDGSASSSNGFAKEFVSTGDVNA